MKFSTRKIMRKRIYNWINRQSLQRLVFLSFLPIFFLYILPTFIQPEYDTDLHLIRFNLGLPGVISGDEPHYLVATTSLINDHDYYVENNYENAYHSGGCDLGFRYRNTTNPTIPPHIQLVDPIKHIALPTISNKTHEENVQIMYEQYNATTVRWVSNRPVGVPFFSSIFLWPLKDTCFIEHGVIYLSVMISIIGIIFFYLISLFYARKYIFEQNKEVENNENEKKSIITALCFTYIFAFATQYWHYSKTYFPEPYIATFLLMSYYLFFIQKQSTLPGFLIALGYSMKSPFGMYLVLFPMALLVRKEWKRCCYFVLGTLLPLGGVLYYNWSLSGNIFYSAQAGALSFGNYAYGIFVWLFHPMFGVIPSAPFLIFSIFGLYNLWRKNKESFFNLSIIIFPYFFFWAFYKLTQVGPGGYSARYLVPLLGFFVLLSMIWYIHNKNKVLQILFFVLVSISFIINLQAAFLYPLFWNNPPWIVFDFITQKFHRIIEVLKQTF